MKVPTYHLGERPATIVFLSDIHIGAEEFREDRFREALAWIEKNKAWVVLNGDIIENAIIEGKAPGEKLLGQASWPTQQWKDALAMFQPLAKKKRILFGTRGNHDGRTRRQALLDVCDILLTSLDVDYLGVGGMVRLEVGNQIYTFAVQHGSTDGTSDPYKENRRLAAVYEDAEAIFLGHNHHLGYEVDYHLSIDDGSEVVRSRHMVRTGTFLGYPDYAREKGYAPRAQGCPIVTLDAKTHLIEIDVETLRWQ